MMAIIVITLIAPSLAAASVTEERDFCPIDPNHLPPDSLDNPDSYRLHLNTNISVNAGAGKFAPRLVTANNGGVITQPLSSIYRASLSRPVNRNRRFSYGFGADAYICDTKSTNYQRWSDQTQSFHKNSQSPGFVVLQQLYAEVKYRGVYLFAGMKENDRSIFDGYLGSGDLTLSNNSRPIPQLRIGFIDFQNIPLTNGWVQIQGDIAYGKFFDNNWLENHYNYYNHFLTTGAWFHYKRCYFRTNPSKPFSVTVGMQHASQFGGTWTKYWDGKVTKSIHHKIRFRDFIDVFYQTKGNDSENPGEAVNFNGNHLGSWDIKMRYAFRNGASLTAYMQKPWEDESGVAWQNGFDAVYGLRYDTGKEGIIEAVSIEYLDFTNQAGPMLWDPTDYMPNKATGADDYYNNFMYNGWANYGLAIGSPAFKAPIYNTDGVLRFTDNHLRGCHVGLTGRISAPLTWRALFSYITSNGTPNLPRASKRDVTSFLAEATYNFNLGNNKGLAVRAQLSFDVGTLYPDAFGAYVSATYSGNLSIPKKKK